MDDRNRSPTDERIPGDNEHGGGPATPKAPASGLLRAIALPHATAMVAGTIIGASIFVQPSEVNAQVSSVPAALAVWALAGLLTVLGALVCAELASTFTGSGGVYVYLRETFGPGIGFLWGWAMFWSVHSGIIAAIAIVVARYVAYFVPLTDPARRGVAIAVIVGLTAVNYRGVRLGSVVQTAFTGGKLLAILLILSLGLALGGRVPEHFVGPAATGTGSAAAWIRALMAGLFAFGGWHMVTYNAEETVAPQRTIPRALLAGTAIVTVAYIGLNAVYMYLLPFDAVATSTRVAADAADAIIGTGGGAAMSALVVFSTVGALSGIILAGPRVYFAMARDGVLPGWMAGIHPRFRTPHRALVLQALWSCTLVATGTFRSLFLRVVYTEWLFFGMMAVGMMLLRRRGRTGAWQMWGFPWTPGLFVLASFAIVVSQLVSDPLPSWAALVFVSLGFPVYLWIRSSRERVIA